MATIGHDNCQHDNGHGQQHGHGHQNDNKHFHLDQFKKRHAALSSLFDDPVAECYEKDSLHILLTLPDSDLLSVKEAFVNPPKKTTDKKALADRATAAGLDPLPEIKSLSTSLAPAATPAATTEAESQTKGDNASIGQPLLDHRFRIGFSRQSGHAIELNNENNSNRVGPKKVESGAFVFQEDEMPYASVIQDVWKGKLCEECLRVLPANKEEIVECPVCSSGGEDTKVGAAPKFCSQTCLQAAWKVWHGHECQHTKELGALNQQTQLALRVYWKDAQCCIALSSSSSTAPKSVSDINSLANATADLAIGHNNQRPRITSKDGSDILLSKLCHNFKLLDTAARMAYLMTGYYLERLLDLPEGSALELAYLQALVKFNSFAIKSRVSEAITANDSMVQFDDYAIGSALYLLASIFNHSCAPNAMVVFGGSRSSGPDEYFVWTTGRENGDNGAKGAVKTIVSIRMYAEAVLQKIFKCPKNGYACRPMTENDIKCPTCGTEIDMATRHKMTQLMARLLTESQDPSLTMTKRMALLKSLEGAQSKMFVDTCILYGNTCDQLAMVYAQTGDLSKSIEWCKKALKVVVVHFPHDSIEVAQETLKLAGLLFNNMQTKEAMKQVQIAITLYKWYYGPNSKHPDLLELYEMEKVLKS
ncbi:SET and MYND domain-containing protein 4, partial [Entomortierella chlamydospora]